MTAPSPNPFAAATTVRFTLAGPGVVRARVIDLRGRVVHTLADGTRAAGEHVLTWDGTGDHDRRLAAGLYVLRLEAGNTVLTRRALLLP
jgi:hypothetical protein